MNIGIIGAGAFSFAIASRCASSPDNRVLIWAESQAKVDEFNETHALSIILDGAKLPESVVMTASMEEAVRDAEIVLVLTAAAFVESVCEQMQPYLAPGAHVIVGSKGACPDGEMPAVGGERAIGRVVSTMGGPGFAIDIIEGVYVGLTLATPDDDCFDKVVAAFAHDPAIVFDRSTDMLGLELCSCIKNAAAIAMGALEGAGYPISTQCLLLQRVMDDLANMLSMVEGGDAATAMSLAGLGDMVLTCFSPKSRNCSYGHLVGEFGIDEPCCVDYLAKTTVEGMTVIGAWETMSAKLGITSRFMDVACKVFVPGGSWDDLLKYITE